MPKPPVDSLFSRAGWPHYRRPALAAGAASGLLLASLLTGWHGYEQARDGRDAARAAAQAAGQSLQQRQQDLVHWQQYRPALTYLARQRWLQPQERMQLVNLLEHQSLPPHGYRIGIQAQPAWALPQAMLTLRLEASPLQVTARLAGPAALPSFLHRLDTLPGAVRPWRCNLRQEQPVTAGQPALPAAGEPGWLADCRLAWVSFSRPDEHAR